MYVKPRTRELKVMDPALGDYLPPEGREVPATDYWLRLRDTFHDVVDAEPPAAADKPAQEQAPAPEAPAQDKDAG